MALWIESVVLLSVLAVGLVFGAWIGVTLLTVALVAMLAYTHSPAGLVMATTVWGSSTAWSLPRGTRRCGRRPPPPGRVRRQTPFPTCSPAC